MGKTPITFDDWLIHFFMQNQVWWTAQCILLVHGHHHVTNCNIFQGVTILKSQPGVKVRMKLQPGQDLFVQLDSQLLSIFFSVFFCTCMEACKLPGFIAPQTEADWFRNPQWSGCFARSAPETKPYCDQTGWLTGWSNSSYQRSQTKVSLDKGKWFFRWSLRVKSKSSSGKKKKNPIVNTEKVSDCALFVCLLIVWKLYG